MARLPSMGGKDQGRIQSARNANRLVYLGASPQTPIYFGDSHVNIKGIGYSE